MVAVDTIRLIFQLSVGVCRVRVTVALGFGVLVAGVWAVVCVQVKYRAFNVRMMFITVAPVQRSPRQRPQ
jgi:hypothetical protein